MHGAHTLRVRSLALAFALAASSLDCRGKLFDPASQVQSLRVFGVRKTVDVVGTDGQPKTIGGAYARPGETVSLEMLLWDAREPKPRDIEVVWIGGCTDPPGDLYYQCLPQLAGALGSGQPGKPGGAKPTLSIQTWSGGANPKFQVTLPGDIVSRRPTPKGSDVPYGIAYVFFAVCAGHVAPSAPGADLPFDCFDDAGNAVSSQDFVPGYTAIYAYDDRRNENPIVGGLSFDGPTLDATSPPPAVDGCEGSCSDHVLQPMIDTASAEIDPAAKDANGDPMSEQLWVAYFSTSGTFERDQRLVNDATTGWNPDNGTKWTPGEAPGPARIWAVVHDNRGGVSWIAQDVVVR